MFLASSVLPSLRPNPHRPSEAPPAARYTRALVRVEMACFCGVLGFLVVCSSLDGPTLESLFIYSHSFFVVVCDGFCLLLFVVAFLLLWFIVTFFVVVGSDMIDCLVLWFPSRL